MFRKIVITGILMFFYMLCYSLQVDAFNQGVMAYNNKDYQKAIESFESIYAEGKESYELHFNLGLSYLNAGEIGLSKLYLERAKLFSPREPELVKAIKIVDEQVATPITTIPDFIVLQKFRKVAFMGSSLFWAILQLIVTFILLFLFYLILFKGIKGMFLAKILPICLSLLLLWSFINSHYRLTQRIDSHSAIVMTENGYLYEGADERSAVVADVSTGVKVTILDQIGAWYKVQLEDKDIGWIETKKVTII